MISRKMKIAALSVLAAITLTGVIGGTVSWFNTSAVLPSEKIEGSLRGAYFAYGDGTAEHPYGIRIPRQLYNLAWLQYAGYFNRDLDKDGKLDTFYFELATDIPNGTLDMSDYVLPPIGTERYPFLGTFNGQEMVVTNLNVSNSFAAYGTNHPTTVTSDNFVQMKDVGMFGAVGSLPNAPLTYDVSNNVIKDFGITNSTITSVTNQTLAGIVGAYVNGDVSGVAVNAAAVDISAANSQPVSGFEKISEHGVIGHVEKEGRTKEITRVQESIYSVNVSNIYEFNAADQGDSPGFGGSIDMKGLYNRLFTIWKSCTNDTSTLNDDRNYATYPTLATQSVAKDGTKGDIVLNYDSSLANASAITGNEDEYFEDRFDNNRAYYNTSVSDEGKQTSSVGLIVEPGSIRTGTRNYDSTSSTYYNKVLDEGRYMCLTGERKIPIANGATLTTSYYDSITGSFISYVDGSTHNYLHYNGSSSTPQNVTATSDESSTASLWEFTSNSIRTNTKNLSSTTYPLADNYYYLNCNSAGTLTITSSNSTTWNKDTRGYYTTVSGTVYYLGFNGTNWVTSAYYSQPVPDESYWMIFNGSNYMTHGTNPTQSDSNYVTTTSNPATNPYPESVRWYLVERNNKKYFSATSSSPYFYIYNTGSRYYYTNYNSNSTASSNAYIYSGTTNEGDNSGELSVTISRTTYYPYFDGSYWDADTSQGRKTTLTFKKVIVPGRPAGFVDDVHAGDIVLSDPTTRYSNQKSTNRYNGGNPDKVTSKARTVPTYVPLKEKETRVGTTVTTTPGVPDDYNTGYIVSGAKYRGDPYGDIRVSVFPLWQISSQNPNALGNSGFTKSTGKIGTVYTINDSGYQQTPASTNTYTKSREYLESNVLKGSNYVFGLHFMNAEISYGAATDPKYIEQEVGQSVFAEKAVINKDTYSNYELPTDCIDFNLKEKGYINFFAGTYYTGNNSFFSLYEVVREGSSIVQLRKISEIYSDAAAGKESPNSYIYKYDKSYTYKGTSGQYSVGYHYVNSVKKKLNGDPYVEHSLQSSIGETGYSRVFQTKWIEGNSAASGSLTLRAAYYFEIAMNSGEYCLGSVKGKNGAYLMYLDIGANAAKTYRTILSEHFTTTETTMVYPLGVAIVASPSSISAQTQQDEKEYLDLACFQINSSYSGKVTIGRNATDDSQVDITRTVAENAVPNFQGDSIELNIASELVPKTNNVSDIKRLQYYDYNVNTQETTRVVITDTSVNGATATRDIKYYDSLDQEITDPEKQKVYRTITGVKYENEATIRALALDSTGDNGLYYVAGSGALLITVKYWEDDENSGSCEYVATMESYVDGSTGKTGYRFKGYNFEVTVDNGQLVLVVTALGTDPNIKISIGGVEVTQVGDTFTFPNS